MAAEPSIGLGKAIERAVVRRRRIQIAADLPQSSEEARGQSRLACSHGLDPGGLKVDGVAYTAADVANEGWTLVF